jgi:hypothetical protein
MIYLEFPAMSASGTGLGYKMQPSVWNKVGTVVSYEDVERYFNAEVACRLLLLIAMLKTYRDKLTPLLWLLHVMSEEGGRQVDAIYCTNFNFHITIQTINHLLEEVKVLTTYYPMTMVDEVQLLASHSAVKMHTNAGVSECTLMKAVVTAVSYLRCPVIWSGTKVGINDIHQLHSPIAKVEGGRQLVVLGSFRYLERDDVKSYLESILDCGKLSTLVINQLSYILQGRPRLLTTYIALLVAKYSGRPDSTIEQDLDDNFALDKLNDFIEEHVVQKYLLELNTFRALSAGNGISDADIGYLWCQSMLMPCGVFTREMSNRSNCLAFTTSVHRNVEEKLATKGKCVASVTDDMARVTLSEIEAQATLRYSFSFRHGEPALQEALLRFVRENPSVALDGIYVLLSSQLDAQSLGATLDMAVMLALICQGDSVLKTLCMEHSCFRQFAAHFDLEINRVVKINDANEEMEWVEKGMRDPNDQTFSALPGVPIKNIAIFPHKNSGADCLCFATSLNDEARAMTIEKGVTTTDTSTGGGCAAMTPQKQAITTQQTRSPYMLRSQKTKDDFNRKDTDLAQTKNEILVVSVVCACYTGGASVSKHFDQERKVQMKLQFSHTDTTAAEAFADLEKRHHHRYSNLPIIVEIPMKTKQCDVSDEYILISEHNAGLLFNELTVAHLTKRKEKTSGHKN